MHIKNLTSFCSHLISLTKPGIIAGNLVVVIAGFYLASNNSVIDYSLLLFTSLGICLVMASGCVFNNYIDRDIDALMVRTKERVLVRGVVNPYIALVYGAILGIVGLFVLYVHANSLATVIALLGWVFYVIVYSLWFKRVSIYGTHIGSISGAIPPVVGYVSVTAAIDTAAIILFAMLSLWQMPHSFAIAIRRLSDYQAAKIVVLPANCSMLATKINMLIFIIAFVVASCSLTIFGYMSIAYLAIAATLGTGWIYLACQGFTTQDHIAWARKMFIVSIAILMSLCITIVLIS